MRLVKTPQEIDDYIVAVTNPEVTAREVAAMVNRKFGTSYTRDAMSVHIRRLGVEHNDRAGKSHCPIGGEYVDAQGRRIRKVADYGPKCERWKYVHRLVWEEHNGPVPKGHAIIFKDGNTLNCDISNLLLVSRRELLAMNREGLMSSDPELTEVGLATAKLLNARNDITKGRRNG